MSTPLAEAMCSPHESINSRMAPGQLAHWELETDMVQARPLTVARGPLSACEMWCSSEVQTWLGCRTRPWLSLCVLSAPVPWTLLGQQSRDAVHWTGLAKWEAQLTSPYVSSLRSRQRPYRADPSLLPALSGPGLQPQRPGTSPRLWETALSGLGLSSVRELDFLPQPGVGALAWPRGRVPGPGCPPQAPPERLSTPVR